MKRLDMMNPGTANVNAAIYVVLTTKYKKDAPEAFRVVKAAGYSYEKENGRYSVFNPVTHKSIICGNECKEYKDGHYEYYIPFLVNYSWNIRGKFSNKVNFQGILETPINRVWIEVQQESYRSCSDIVEAYRNKVSTTRQLAQSYEKDIESYKKQIAELQERMTRAMWRKTELDLKAIAAVKELKARMEEV
jgi:hypothetical protein